MVAVAAFPTPGAAGSPYSAKSHHKHPPYRDMIVKAIEALKDHKGSSRPAISKYISENYTGLPASHSSLLSKHLRRLFFKNVICKIKHSYKLTDTPASGHSGSAVGSKRRGRPPKIYHPAPAVLNDSPKRRGRPRKFEADPPPVKKSKSGRLLNPKTPAAVDSASVYILPQAEQLESGFLQSLPGAVAIILPQGLLNKKTARSPLLILPNGFQSLVNVSAGKKKLGRPRKDAIQKSPELSKKIVKMQPVQRREKSIVPKQVQLLHNEDRNDRVNSVVRKPGRPRKINNSVLSENLQLKSINEDKLVSAGATLGILQNAQKPIIPEVGRGKQKSPVFLLKKKAVGRPRKIAIGGSSSPP